MTDFSLSGGGTVYLLHPHNPDAAAWIENYLPEDAMRLGGGVAIEWRYVDDIVDGIKNCGLTVERV